ncbi:FdtA/QdtA family cupin domain-containing protein [Cysteiniphilum sp. QT6929]|uniref:sugar 3,4-ketoisomerase n=1 Tax=Cysteiniphilum sp. QT6929 TaxID=2975055 RepID=UPI0024B36718|nr:FdtA/QdtA family cupin domain-containing protein [Cysteiniphilum sp. QT6929]WHN66361.1 FdtA/QdtA family cupin domain-containing protein [Cysteiniphilum sp. QT6929]
MQVEWVELYNKSDNRGSLIVAEAQKNIPFEIKRVYCLYGLNSESRGFHAHKDLQQVMVCLSGTCEVVLDNGISKKTVKLNNTSKALLIDKMVWHEMHEFSADCVLMVLASDWYDESDYIRDYPCFLKKGN